MYAIENKLSLITIIALVAININAKEVPLLTLSPGDIVNINGFEKLSAETTGNIFDGYNAKELIKPGLSIKTRYATVKKEKCLSLESLVSYYYPEIVIDDIEQGPAKIFKGTDRLNYNYFGIRKNYIDNKYLYGIVEICKVEKTQNINIQVINERDFPPVNRRMNYKLLLDETAVLRVKGKNETHFVSSITTGDCLLQVYVNEAEKCDLTGESHKKKNSDDFFPSYLHRSRVIIASNKRDLENTINDELDNSGKSLVSLSNDLKTFTRIFDLLDQYVVIRLKLLPLPELTELSNTNVKNSIAYPTLLRNLKPGDIINVDDLKNIDSSITIDNMLVDVYDETINRSTTFKYTDCLDYDVNDTVKLDFVTYRSYHDYPAESYYKFGIFNEMIKRKHYGLDRKYLNNNYKCVTTTICSEFERRKLIVPTIRVINLNRETINYSKIFNSENIVLRYKINNETHYVARTERGNCLFQALVFPNSDKNSNHDNTNFSPLQIGKIISASDDPVFENWAENFINKMAIHSKTLIGVMNNPEAKVSFFSQFVFSNHNITIINIYLDNLY